MGIDDRNMYLQLCVVKINEIVHIKASKCSVGVSYTTVSLTVVITGFGLLQIDDLKTHVASRFSGFCPVTFHICRGWNVHLPFLWMLLEASCLLPSWVGTRFLRFPDCCVLLAAPWGHQIAAGNASMAFCVWWWSDLEDNRTPGIWHLMASHMVQFWAIAPPWQG